MIDLRLVNHKKITMITLPTSHSSLFSRKRHPSQPRFAPYFFLIPNMLIFGVFVLFPALYNFGLSFFTGNSISEARFVGLENYEKLLTSEDLFWRAVQNTFTFVSVEVIATVLLALGIAVLLNRKVRFRAFFRSAFFYPVLLSPVVVALIWKWVLQHQYGVLNAGLAAFGMNKIPWLLNSQWAMTWTIAITLWASIGFYALILLAGLQAIPGVLYEAAAIDGANETEQFFNITLPMLSPTLLVVVILSLIRAFQSFDLIYVLTNGGPGTSTLMLVQYIFRTMFEFKQFGLAAAASFLLAMVLLILTGAQLYLGRRLNDST
jgi:alpha-1,4-digalacturonate transport system permease protein